MAGHVAVVGVTGAVGQEFLAVLEQRNFPFEKITFMASARSAGKPITFKGKTYTVVELKEDSFKGVDLALFSAGGSISKKFGPIAAADGCVVVDNSSAFRMDPKVPLVVPEVNPGDVKWHKGIIANPNCSTIIMNVPVWPLHKVNPIKRLVVSTYQAVSGAGAWGLWELDDQIKAYVEGKPIVKNKFPHQIVHNLFSHNSKIDANGYNEEENKMVNETRKIFHAPDMLVTATCVRVPIPRAHSESINMTFSRPITEHEVREILAKAPGVQIVDDREKNYFPMPLESSDGDDVLVGRIRQDISQTDGCGIEMFVSGDQLRKGAALNAVQIAEIL